MANVFDNSKNLPHYTARKESGLGKEEPIYQNHFLLTFILPPGIQGADLLSSAVTSISGVNPNPGSAAVEQKYRGATRSFASGEQETTVNDLTVNFNANLNSSNQFYVYKILKAIKEKVHNPRTGRKGLKKDYAAMQMIFEQFNREGLIFRRIVYGDCWLTSPLPEVAGDYSGGDLLNLEGLVFRADFWDEELI